MSVIEQSYHTILEVSFYKLAVILCLFLNFSTLKPMSVNLSVLFFTQELLNIVHKYINLK